MAAVLATSLGRGLLGHFQRVGGQQVQERIVGRLFDALGEGEQAFFELRVAAFGLTGGVPPVEADHGHDQGGSQGEGQSKEQEHARAHHAGVGERELVGHQHGHHGQDQGCRRGYGRSAGYREQTQTPFQRTQIIGQAIERFHAASLSTERC